MQTCNSESIRERALNLKVSKTLALRGRYRLKLNT
jgi:hypothetical protein